MSNLNKSNLIFNIFSLCEKLKYEGLILYATLAFFIIYPPLSAIIFYIIGNNWPLGTPVLAYIMGILFYLLFFNITNQDFTGHYARYTKIFWVFFFIIILLIEIISPINTFYSNFYSELRGVYIEAQQYHIVLVMPFVSFFTLLLIGIFEYYFRNKILQFYSTLPFIISLSFLIFVSLPAHQFSIYFYNLHFVFSNFYNLMLLVYALFLWIYIKYKPYINFLELTTVFLITFVFFLLFLLISTRNFAVLFFSSELLSITLLITLAYNNNTAKHNLSVIFYFLINSLATAFFIFCLFSLSSFVINLNYSSVYYYIFENNDSARFYVLGIVIVFLFKLGFFPVYQLIFDVYENISWFLFSFVSNFYKLFLFFVLVLLFPMISFFLPKIFFVLIGYLSCLIGAVGIVKVLSLRRLFLFSSLFNYGLAFLVYCSGYIHFSLVYLIVYSLVMLAVFSIFMFYESLYSKSIDSLDFFANKNLGIVTYFFLFLLLIVAGFPPLFLFWFKIAVYAYLLNTFGLVLFIFLLLLFAIITFAYIRIIKYILHDNTKNESVLLEETPYFLYFFVFLFYFFVLSFSKLYILLLLFF